MSSDEEALVPGDEDEQGLGEELPTPQLPHSKGRKRRKLASTTDSCLRRPTSDPQVYRREKRVKSRKKSSTVATQGITESCGIVQTRDKSLEQEEDFLTCPTSPPRHKRDASSSNLRKSSPMKKSRGFRKTSTALLRRTGTLSDIRDDRKTRKKLTQSREDSPGTEMLLTHFHKILAEDDSALLRLLLQHATKTHCTEGTQTALLFTITELLLIPDLHIQTSSSLFLSSYLQHDIDDGYFPEEIWNVFYGKNVEAEDSTSVACLTTLLDRISWAHIAESYLIILFTKSNFFRDAFRTFTRKLEKNSESSRKKHKIFPLLFSFFSDMASDTDKFPIIFTETLTDIKNALSAKIPLDAIDGLFRIFISAVVSLFYNPRRWNFDIASDFSPFLRKTLQSIAMILESAMLQPDYQCSNQIESSLVENMSLKIRELLVTCTSPIPPDGVMPPRILTWPDIGPLASFLYNYILQNFEKIWPHLIRNAPSVTGYFIPFAVASLQAVTFSTQT